MEYKQQANLIPMLSESRPKRSGKNLVPINIVFRSFIIKSAKIPSW
jgi:hypothetical protein